MSHSNCRLLKKLDKLHDNISSPGNHHPSTTNPTFSRTNTYSICIITFPLLFFFSRGRKKKQRKKLSSIVFVEKVYQTRTRVFNNSSCFTIAISLKTITVKSTPYVFFTLMKYLLTISSCNQTKKKKHGADRQLLFTTHSNKC